MTEQNFTIETILAQLSKGYLDLNDLDIFLNNTIEPKEKLIEKLCLEIALRYWKGQMSYEDGDYIMNSLHGHWVGKRDIDQNYLFKGAAWQCYLAFDAGEFYHGDDDRSIDPVEKYTKPQVESLLREQKLIE